MRIPIIAIAVACVGLGCNSPGVVLEDDDKVDDGGGGDDGGSGSGSGSGSGDGGGSGDGDDGTDADVDDDGDGWSEEDGDCDDTDAEINPDGDEGDEADGVDDDCNGVADDRTVCDDTVADYTGIQDAIDDVPEDFTVLICPGTYEEDLTIDDDRVTLQSTDGADVTIVEGSGGGPVLTISGMNDSGGNPGAGVVGLTFTGGAAENGGGIYAIRSHVEISDSVIEGNTATNRGGGGYFEDVDGTVQTTRFEDNEAYEGGGVVSWESGVTFDGIEVIANNGTTVDEEVWSSGSGGGGMMIYGNNTIENSTFDGNTSAYNGGGLYVLYGRATIENNTFSGNYSGEDGGGVYFNQARATFDSNLVLRNEAYDDAGGARAYTSTSTFTNNEFIENEASDDAGGMKLSHSTNTVENNWFEGNSTGDAGGGLELDNDTTNVSDCTFIGNTSGRGAGLHSWRNEGRVTLQDLHFEGNEAADCGGAIQIDNDPYMVTIKRVTAWENKANDGGVFCVDKKAIDTEFDVDEPGNMEESYVTVSASLFVDNTASDDGVGLYNKTGHVTFENVTIADSDSYEGAIAQKEGSTTLVNVDISNIDGGGSALLLEEGTIDASYSNFYDLDGGVIVGGESPVGSNGNIAVDPDYNDPGSRDYSLSSGSDLIDAGDPSIEDTDGSRSDIGSAGGPDA